MRADDECADLCAPRRGIHARRRGKSRLVWHGNNGMHGVLIT